MVGHEIILSSPGTGVTLRVLILIFPGCWHFDIGATCILDDVLHVHVELPLLLVLNVLL